MEYGQSWRDQYRDLTFRVVKWSVCWNYYIYIPIDDVPQELRLKIRDERFYDTVLWDRYWWHGGCTHYSLIDGRKVKVGCDYNHSFDQRVTYILESIVEDAKKTIDSIKDYDNDHT